MIDEQHDSIQLNEVKADVVQRVALWHAHQVRNQLTSVTGFLQLFAETASAQHQLYLNVMMNDVKRLLDSIEEMELFITKGQPHPRQAVNMSTLLEETIAGFSNLSKSIRVQGRIPSEPVFIEAVKLHLKRALYHVIRNAVDASPEDACIHVSMGLKSDLLTIECSDSGAGMKPETLASATEPFFTTKVDGLGLGLFIVSRVVEKHNGNLMITSVPGDGTTVRIELPVA